MKGYDQEPEATHHAIDEDGWLHTGDLATMDKDEYFRITGRAKDMIIRGGENVYPREVEEFLHTHPKIAEVQVVGLPDARLGEAVAAWIRLKEPAEEEEIREFCRGRIAHFKVPQYIRFVECVSDDGYGQGSEVSDSREWRFWSAGLEASGEHSDGVTRWLCIGDRKDLENRRRVFRRLGEGWI